MRTGIVAILILVACSGAVGAQNLPHYKKIVKELSSARYQGRGYARDGVIKAGNYIADEFRRSGVDEVTLQPFTINVNTFPGKTKMWVDGHRLKAGSEFTMREYSPGVKGEFGLYVIDTLNYDSEKIFRDLAEPQNKNVFVVCDFWFTYKHPADFKRLQSADGSTNAGLLLTWDTPLKFYKAYAEKVVAKPIVWTTAEAVKGASRIRLDVENEFLENYESSNVIAKVSGARHDSCFVFTAHYDHLGNFGKLWFPGANDNASGTAGIITLAEYYAANKPQFDMYFVAFSGEDTNLRGSTYFAEHPSAPLESVKYLFNLDMIGDNNPVQYCEVSDAGMYAFPVWEQLNAAGGYFKALNRGELAANSDHYPFAVRGVPCIFFENEEGDAFKYYHTAEDNWKNSVFDSYKPVFKLVTDFVKWAER